MGLELQSLVKIQGNGSLLMQSPLMRSQFVLEVMQVLSLAGVTFGF